MALRSLNVGLILSAAFVALMTFVCAQITAFVALFTMNVMRLSLRSQPLSHCLRYTEDDASCEIEGTAILLRYKRPSLYPSMLPWQYGTESGRLRRMVINSFMCSIAFFG